MSLAIAQTAAQAVQEAFDEYRREMRLLMRRAQARFEQQDWHGVQADAVERLVLREQKLLRLRSHLSQRLGERLRDKALWAQMKRAYSGLIAPRPDLELAETFFSSATRRVFGTVGVDDEIEYTASGTSALGHPRAAPEYSRFLRRTTTADLVRDVLTHRPFTLPYQDLERDARRIAGEIDARWQAIWLTNTIARIETLNAVLYRGKGAYIVGRIIGGDRMLPMVIALLNEGQGIFADAVLLSEDDVSIVFSFTRKYFHVDLAHPGGMIQFLISIMPRKRIAELYIALGYYKHGKTELYRDVQRYLVQTRETFERAPGERGMVMIVFTLPHYDLVFKVIRDRFEYPKTTTHAEVRAKYSLVFQHDRAGRLVDAQEFQEWAFPRERFDPSLLNELTQTAASSVTVTEEHVVIHHLYVERRVTPLNLYLREMDDDAACEAALDFGQALKDLAATNIFPGDMLLKNFGVTRHRRVIFYDYDELCLLTDCRFRDLPQPRDLEEEMQSEAWFYVAENDIFPEEFLTFMGLQGAARQVFLGAHRDLLTADYWRQMQARHRAGEVIDIFPYRPNRRFQHPSPVTPIANPA